jgi:hypothetical protein
MHFDNIEGASLIKAWQTDPKNKAVSVKGDDRSPAWTWTTYAYKSGGKLVLPCDNIMTALRSAGTQKEIPGGKHGKTFKDATQYGLLPTETAFDLLIGGKPVPTKKIDELWGDNDFAKHEKFAESLGFKLFAKRAKIGQAKHIRVRPMFDDWSVKGSLIVTEQAITEAVLGDLLFIAGDRAGVGDWRPSSKTPGPFGRFSVTLKRVA